MFKRSLLLFLLAVPLIVSAQYKTPKTKRSGFSHSKSRVRREYIVGLGAANFLGELGGANHVGTFFIKDLEFSATRPSLQLGMRYKFKPHWAAKGGFYYNLVSGDDKLTQEPYRNNRNLSFRSNILELSVQGEFYYTKEQTGHLYKIKNAKGMKSYDFQGYLFAGVGVFFYNPKARYHGSWVALQPLGTEGQGLPGGPKKYSRVSLCIPYGIGGSYMLTKDWAVGLEIGIRKTFTDYIDDVSTVYYDNSAIAAAHGPTAAYLADPSLHNYPVSLGGDATGYWQSAPGQQRGDKTHMDAYMFLNFTASYKVPYKRRTRSKF